MLTEELEERGFKIPFIIWSTNYKSQRDTALEYEVRESWVFPHKINKH